MHKSSQKRCHDNIFLKKGVILVYSKLIAAFEKNNGILTAEMVNILEINQYILKEAVEQKIIQKYNNEIYLLDESYFDDLYLLQLKYSESVYSHHTAIMLHWLSTDFPFFYHLTLPKKINILLSLKNILNHSSSILMN